MCKFVTNKTEFVHKVLTVHVERRKQSVKNVKLKEDAVPLRPSGAFS